MSITLNNGLSMPAIGLGTYNAFKSGEVGPAVETALREGYRLIDCAHFYGNEAEIGVALQRSFKEGVVKREDIFITSKLWCNSKHPDDVITACRQSLHNLQLEYLDLYLVHWPMTLARGAPFPVKHESQKLGYDADREALCWERMEECVNKGLAKSIGISNFSITKTELLLERAKIVPAVNQVECHVHFQQSKLKYYCGSKGIVVQCFYPLGGRKKREEIFKDIVVNEIAAKHKASLSQVCLAYALHRGCSIIPKSVNATRIAENFKSTEIKLDEEDVARLKGIDKNTRFCSVNDLVQLGDDVAEVLWDVTADSNFVL